MKKAESSNDEDESEESEDDSEASAETLQEEAKVVVIPQGVVNDSSVRDQGSGGMEWDDLDVDQGDLVIVDNEEMDAVDREG